MSLISFNKEDKSKNTINLDKLIIGQVFMDRVGDKCIKLSNSDLDKDCLIFNITDNQCLHYSKNLIVTPAKTAKLNVTF